MKLNPRTKCFDFLFDFFINYRLVMMIQQSLLVSYHRILFSREDSYELSHYSIKRRALLSLIKIDGSFSESIRRFSKKNPFFLLKTDENLILLNLHNNETILLPSEKSGCGGSDTVALLTDLKTIYFIQSSKVKGTTLGIFNYASIL